MLKLICRAASCAHRTGVTTKYVYLCLFAVGTVTAILVAVSQAMLPLSALFSLIPMFLLVPVVNLGRQDEFTNNAGKISGLNVITILTPLSLSLAILLK